MPRAIAALSILLSCAGLFAWGGLGLWLPTGLMLIGGLLFGGASTRIGFAVDSERAGIGHWLGLAGVLLVAAFLRLYALDTYPHTLDYDSVQNGWIGLKLVEQLPTYEPVLERWASGNETAFIYVLGFSLKLFGHTLTALRLPAAVAGLLTVLAVYLLGRDLFSRQVGLAAAFLLALSPWHTYISRMAKQPILVPLIVALVLLCLARALRAKRSPTAWVYCVVCGLFVGAGLHSYEASRVLPLAVAVALIWVRRTQGCIKRGWAELGVIAVSATVVALPILVFAARHWGLYMEHVGINSIFNEVSDKRSMMPLLANIVDTLGFFLIGLPGQPGKHTGLPAALMGLMPPLFVFGLVGLWGHRRSQRLDPHGRELLLATLALMAIPFMLARFHIYSPRRYTGTLIPFYLMAGGAIVGTGRMIALRWGAAWQKSVVTLGTVAALTVVPAIFQMLTLPRKSVLDTSDVQVLRWAHQQSARREVYLAPSLVRAGYLSGFFFEHPSLSELPTAWPLPGGPLAKQILLISTDEPWWPVLARLFDARRQTVQLKLPNGKLARLVVYQMAPEKIRSLRFTPDRLRQPFVASLLVPQPGVFRFRASADSSLRIGLQRLRVKHAGNERSVCLATGLHRIEYSPARPGEIIEWLPPGASGWEPLPATLCWRLPPGSLPPAQPTRTLRVTFRQTKMLPVPVAPPYHYNRVLQDLAKSSGGYYILDLDRYLLKRWRGGPQIHMDPILRQADGHPFQYRQRYEADRPKEFSLSVAEGIYLLQRREKTIHRFDRNGSRLGTLAGPFVTPVDLAATKAAILVADPGQQALLSCDPAGKREARTLVRDIRPVAVAALEGRIAYLDQRRHQLVVCGPNGATRRTIQLGRVARRMRLSLASNGQMVLCDPDKNRVLLFGANGDLLAPGSDPLALTPWLTRVEEQPAAAHFDSRTKQLTILGLHGKLLQFDQLVPPDHRAGLTLRSVDAQSNLNKTAHADFGAGLVIDGGLHPAFCRWRFTIEPEGTYEVWAYYAVDDERPLTLTVDGKVRAQGLIQLTGGYTVRDLRWHLLGKVRLDRGHHTLELTTESLFPHLARVRLVRQ